MFEKCILLLVSQSASYRPVIVFHPVTTEWTLHLKNIQSTHVLELFKVDNLRLIWVQIKLQSKLIGSLPRRREKGKVQILPEISRKRYIDGYSVILTCQGVALNLRHRSLTSFFFFFILNILLFSQNINEKAHSGAAICFRHISVSVNKVWAA